jgi:hypothetical protein
MNRTMFPSWFGPKRPMRLQACVHEMHNIAYPLNAAGSAP